MLDNKHIAQSSITFSQWSRKGYAIFASLHQVVKIGQLKIAICIQAIKKNISLITELFFQLTDNEYAEDMPEDQLVDLLALNILNLETTTSGVELSAKNKIEIYTQGPCLAFAVHGLFNFRNHGKCE